MTLVIRDTRATDFPAIIALNTAFEQYTSSLDPVRLTALHAMAAHHRVAERSGDVVGFLLALREGAAYDSPNYQWFDQRLDMLLYVDRIVVADGVQGQAIGRRLYDDLFAFALETGVPHIACEISADPPNLRSQRFHDRYGFTDLGIRHLAPATKPVSLRLATLKDRTP